MPMEMDPDKINDSDRYVESKLLEQTEIYAASRVRSRKENEIKATSRKRVADLGLRTDAYQIGIRLVKDLTEGERADFMRDLGLVLKVLGARQADLFPDEVLKAEKRAQKARDREAKAGRSKAELDAASDSNPKSDPAAGGAGKRGRKAKGEGSKAPQTAGEAPKGDDDDGETGDELIARAAAEKNAELEQKEGGVLLENAGKPKSQSQISAEKLEAAKLN